MKTPLLWSCLAFLGILSVWLFWLGREDLVTDQDSTPPQGSPQPANIQTQDIQIQAPAKAEDTRQRMPATPARSMRIHVLYKADRTPVAGAIVTGLDTRRMSELRKESGWTLDAEAARRAATTETTTDTGGNAELPRQAERYLVEATQRDLWGRAYVGPKSKGPFEILLEKDHSLQVRVRSEATGQPVPGVPVWLRRFSLYGLVREAAFARTESPNGIATFQHVQQTLNREGRWQVFLGVPQRKQSFAPVSMAELPTEPVELILHDTGSVIVKIRDENHAPVDGRKLRCELVIFPTAARVKPMAIGSYWASRPVDKEGIARLSPIGVGLFLRVKVSTREADSLHKPVVVELASPSRSGETATCEVLWRSASDPQASYPVVSGRLVHRDKSPWPKARIHVYPMIFPTPRTSSSTRSVELSKEGRFRFALREPCPEGGKRSYRFWTDGRSEFGALEARLDLSRKFPPGETDIGDVVLDLGQLLVSGRVVDAEGKPLPMARLRVAQLVIPAIDERAQKVNKKEFWPSVDCVGGYSIAKDGSFAMHAIPGMELPTGRLRLEVSCSGLLSADPIDFDIGTKGLRVVLQPGGAVEGSVRLAPGQAREEIAVMVRVGGRVFSTSVKQDGTFHRGGLPAGRGKLIAWSRAGHAGRATRVVIDDLVIQPGVTNRDPRIQNLAVTDSRDGAQVEVFGEDGEPVMRATIRRLEGKEEGVTYTDYKGHGIVQAKEFPLKVAVSGFGYAEKRVSLKAGKNKVILARGLTIELHTMAKAIGKDPDYHLGFGIYHVDPKTGGASGHVYGGSFPYNRRYFDSTGKASVPVPGPGTYEVRPWVYIHGKDNIGRGGTVGERPFPRIEVVAHKPSQRFEIPVPAGVLADTVRRHLK